MMFAAKQPSLLEKILTEHKRRGWSLEDLEQFRMENPPKDPPLKDPPPPDPQKDDPPEPPKTFTQDEVTRMMAREKREGKESGVRSVAEQLGVSVEEAKTIIAERNEASEKKKTEDEKRIEAAEKKSAEAEAKVTAAEEKAFTADLRSKLLEMGINPAKLANAVKLVEASYTDEEEKVTDAVDKFVEETPEWFTSEEETPGPPGSRLPKGPPKPSGDSKEDRVKARLQARHGSRLTQPSQN